MCQGLPLWLQSPLQPPGAPASWPVMSGYWGSAPVGQSKGGGSRSEVTAVGLAGCSGKPFYSFE